MLNRLIGMFAIGVIAIQPTFATPVRPTPVTPFALVQGFVRHLGTLEADRARAAADQAANKSDFASCVRNMTTFQIDLQVAANFFLGTRLSADNMAKDIPPLFGTMLQQKYVIVGDIMKECEAFITPDPKVDYDELAKRAPKLTAMSNYLDKSLFEASPAIFASLISPRADSQNHANHLVISREQRNQLLNSLRNEFGEKLNMTGNDVPYYVATAQLLRDKLNEFKCSDGPWM